MLENLPDPIGVALRDQRAGLDKIAFNQWTCARALVP